jgi:hypothetical protein
MFLLNALCRVELIEGMVHTISKNLDRRGPGGLLLNCPIWSCSILAAIFLAVLGGEAHADMVFATFQNAELQFENTTSAATTGLFSAGTPLQVTFEFQETVSAHGETYLADQPVQATVSLSSYVNGAVSGTRSLDQALQNGTLTFTDRAGYNLLTVSDFTGDLEGNNGGSTANLDTDTTLPDYPDIGTYSSDFLTFPSPGDVVDSSGLTLELNGKFTEASGLIPSSRNQYLASFTANANGSFSGDAVPNSLPEPSVLGVVWLTCIALLSRRRRDSAPMANG